jgi:sulfur carrier protein
MKIRIIILPENSTKEVDIEPGSSVNDLLMNIQLKPDAIIVLRDNIPIPVDDILTEEQELRIVQVASGG